MMHVEAQNPLRLSDRAQSKIRGLMKAGASGEGNIELFTEGVTLVADPGTFFIAQNRFIDYAGEGFPFARDGACERPSFPE